MFDGKMNLMVFYGLLVFMVFGTACRAGAEGNALSGDYFGSAAITAPADLGNVDLAFHLDINDGGGIAPATSYVILNKTILFPQTGTLPDGIPIGPAVKTGSTFSGLNLHLALQPFTTEVDGKTVSRSIVLDGTATDATGKTVEGDYTETMTGYLSESVVVQGTFTLVRPVSITEGEYACKLMDTLDPKGELTLPEIQAGGSDPTRVEFDDISCAVYLYHHPDSGPTVSQATLQAAIADYKATLP